MKSMRNNGNKIAMNDAATTELSNSHIRSIPRTTKSHNALLNRKIMSDSSDIEINVVESESDTGESLNGIKKMRTVFLLGFVDRRLHNQLLYTIIQDLSPYYFVAANPLLQLSEATMERTTGLIANAEVLIFLMNEFTLKDHQCLKLLQYAWELMIPVTGIRSPRMRLVINNQNSSLVASMNPDLNLPMLQDIMYQTYKNSLEFDRLQHKVSMKRLLKRLALTFQDRQLLPPMIVSNHRNDGSWSPKSENQMLRLPPISPIPFAPSPIVNNTLKAGLNNRRSRSLQNLNHTKKYPSTPKKPKPQPEKTGPQLTNQISEDELLIISPTPRFMNIEDPDLFHETQYLVFPRQDKSQKPKLIKFPSDIICPKATNDLELQSIWGSDSSLEQAAEREAVEVTGGQLDMISPPATPAPFENPL